MTDWAKYGGFTRRVRKRWKRWGNDPTMTPELWLLIDWLIDHAVFKDQYVNWRGEKVFLKRGQVIFGQRKLAAFLRISHQKLRTLLGNTVITQFLTQQTTHRFTIATILKYDIYNPLENANQHSEQHSEAEKTTHPSSRKNERKNVLPPPSADTPPPLSGEKKNPTPKPKKIKTAWPKDFELRNGMREYAAAQGYDPEKVEALFETWRLQCVAKGYTYKDWVAAYQNMCRSDWSAHRRYKAPTETKNPWDV